MNILTSITSATYITLVRIILVIPLAYACIYDHLIIAGVIFVIAAFTDLLDGYIARTYHQESLLGALLDPLADKLLILTLCTVLFFVYSALPAWFIIFLWIKESIMAAGGIFMFYHGYQIPQARSSGKLAMCAQVVYCLLLFVNRYTKVQGADFFCYFLAGVTLITVYALIDYVKVGYTSLNNQ